MELIFDDRGQIRSKHQIGDYVFRGELLNSYGVYQFFRDTWEAEKKGETDPSIPTDTSRRSGRPRHRRFPYLSQHPAHHLRWRILRNRGHNNLPSFVGRYFPRSDDPAQHHFYCACMLLLFKPWRRIQHDLKHPSQTWQQAWDSFLQQAPNWVRGVVDNIQYYYESEPSQPEDAVETVQVSLPVAHFRQDHLQGIDFDMEVDDTSSHQLTSAELMAAAIDQANAASDDTWAESAVRIAQMAGLFPSPSSPSWGCNSSSHVYRAEGQDLTRLSQWRLLLDEETHTRPAARSLLNEALPGSLAPSSSSGPNHQSDLPARVFPISSLGTSPSSSTLTTDPQCRHSTYQQFFHDRGLELNEEQYLAFDILSTHLDHTLAGFHPPPLYLKLVGPGGTGKTRVIDSVTGFFEFRGQKALLLRSAPTGIAACLIEGQTLHSLGHMSVNRNGNLEISDKVRRLLQQIWFAVQYLIIDEYSMLYKTFFALFSRRLSIAKSAENPDALNQPFGGISVLLAGDHHQFPPVGAARDERLYVPNNLVHVGPNQTPRDIGGMLYEQFNRCVILREQKRVQDPVYLEFLQALRHGRVTSDHVEMLRDLLLQPEEFDESVEDNPWLDAPLITPRNSVRLAWNSAAIRRHCRRTGQRLYICPAGESLNHQPLTDNQRLRVKLALNHRRKKGNRKDLPSEVELAIGAKVLFTENLDTDLDVANGAKGVIVDIVLHPDEPPIPDDVSEVRLRYLPAYILVRMDRTRASCLPGLEPNVIPITPLQQRLTIQVPNPSGQGPPLRRTIVRRQFPITGAYAFTDYRAQGQTLRYVIIDISKPPSGNITLVNLYVALSRGIGRDNIRILRDFNEDLFFGHLDEDIQQEDERLEAQAIATKEWWRNFQVNHVW